MAPTQPSPGAPHADEYIGRRPGEGEEAAPLFRAADGAPLTVERAYEMLRAYATQVGMGEEELQFLL
jgi:hypothetical protein